MERKQIARTVLVALFAALVAAGAFIKIPFVPVPITLQTLFALLAAACLPVSTALLSVIVYLLIGAAGLPVFTSGGGIAAMTGPTGGYLFGMIPAAIAGSLVMKALESRIRLASLVSALVSTFCLYLVGHRAALAAAPVPVIAILDDGAPLDDADEAALVVQHGHKVLGHGGGHQFVHLGVHRHRQVVPLAGDGPHGNVLGVFDADALVLDGPEQVAFGHGSHILAFAVEHGDGGIAVVLHLFQSLPQGEIIVYKSHVLFGGQKKQDVHDVSPFALIVPYPEGEGVKKVLNPQNRRRKNCVGFVDIA